MIRWLRYWRSSVLVVAAAVLVGLLAVLVVTSISDRENALQVAKRVTANEQTERVVLNHRIDQLLAQATALETSAQANSAQLAVLRREVSLLQQQVRDLGGQPVVSGSASSGGTSEAASPSPKPSRSPAPGPSPSATPTPTPSPSRTCVLIICPRVKPSHLQNPLRRGKSHDRHCHLPAL